MKIEFQNKQARLSMLHQDGTYAGLLCGIPNEELNNHIIDGAVKEANRRLFAADTQNISVYLIKPTITINENIFPPSNLAPLETILKYPMLPSYITTMLVTDFDRQAVIVAFTESIGDIDSVKEHLKTVDWLSISESFCW